MGNIENTAVNELVTQAAGEITTEPIGTTTGEVMREVVRLDARPVPSPRPRAAPPGAAAFDRHARMAFPVALELAGPTATRWVTRLRTRFGRPDSEHTPTIQLRRRRPRGSSLPAALLLGAGMVAGAYLALRGRDALPVVAAPDLTPTAPVPERALSPTPAPRPAVTPAPEQALEGASGARDDVAAAVATPVTGAAPPAPVDVRLESTPSGATVMLVDRGRTQLIGVTPVVAALDPSRAYDLVFTYADEPARIERLDPAATRRVAVVLGGADAGTPAQRRTERPVSAQARPRSEHAAATGTLMISSKPPCEIEIDGQPTGLTTPQRSIALPAGPHEVALINGEKAIRKIVAVRIAPDTTAKIIEDLMP